MSHVGSLNVHPTADDLSHQLYREDRQGGYVNIGPLGLHFHDRATITAVVEELVKLHDAIANQAGPPLLAPERES